MENSIIYGANTFHWKPLPVCPEGCCSILAFPQQTWSEIHGPLSSRTDIPKKTSNIIGDDTKTGPEEVMDRDHVTIPFPLPLPYNSGIIYVPLSRMNPGFTVCTYSSRTQTLLIMEATMNSGG
ncbi:hypothetical protein Pelo_18821 [Pelomyxa schiedti]|nr:hypothetical protein Pelo_18821 [Pelomyxa schiedti]